MIAPIAGAHPDPELAAIERATVARGAGDASLRWSVRGRDSDGHLVLEAQALERDATLTITPAGLVYRG